MHCRRIALVAVLLTHVCLVRAGTVCAPERKGPTLTGSQFQEMLERAIVERRPLTLECCHIRGTVDIGKLPARHTVVPLAKARLYGLKNLRDDLQLVELERDNQARVTALRVISSPIRVTNCHIAGSFLDSGGSRAAAKSGVPTIFERDLDLRGSTIDGSLAFEHARFLADLRLEGATVNGEVNLRHSQVHGDALLDELVVKGARIDLSRATFRQSLSLRCTEGSKAADLKFGFSRFYADVKLGCTSGKRQSVGTLDAEEALFLGGRPRFEHLDVARADFTRARFDVLPVIAWMSSGHAISFNEAKFRQGLRMFGDGSLNIGSLDLQETEFLGSVAFTDMTIVHAIDARNATFRSRLDVAGWRAPYAGFRSAEFFAPVSVADSHIGGFDFHGARFHENAAFSGLTLGQDPACKQANRVVLNLERARFEKTLRISGTTLDGTANLSYFGAPSGEFSIEWARVRPFIRSAIVDTAQGTRCMTPTSIPGAMQLADIYRNLEENFRKRGELEEANAAAFFRQQAISDPSHQPGRLAFAVAPSVVEALTDFGLSCIERRASECIWGYGFRPLRPLFWFLVLILITTALTYTYVRRSKSMIAPDSKENGGRFQPLSLPIADEPALELYAYRESRASTPLEAVLLSISVVSAFELRSLRLRPCTGAIAPSLRVAYWILRAAGVGAVFLFVTALSQTIPVLNEFFKVLLPR